MLNITRDKAPFRPVTIRIENRDDFDKLLAIVSAVSHAGINHPPQLINAARELHRTMLQFDEDSEA